MTFTVHCSGCNAAFPIDSAKVPFPGVYAECSECSSVFLVRPPEGDAHDHASASATTMIDTGATLPGAQYETLPAEPLYEVESAVDVRDAPDFEQAPEHDFPELPSLESAPHVDADLPDTFDDTSFDETESDPEPHAAAVEFTDSAMEIAEPFEDDPEPVTAAGSDPVPAAEPDPVYEPAPEPMPEPEPEPTPAPSVSPFGRRDPHERARRLARVLVSDMIAYYPDRHRQSLRAGSLAKDFEDEIEKSWSEYVDQVGKDMADETTYFKDALNDVLAEGNEIF